MEEKLEDEEQIKVLSQNNLLKIIPKNDNTIDNLEFESQLLNKTSTETNNPVVPKSTRRGFRNQIILTFCINLITAVAGMVSGYPAVILPQLYNSNDPLTIDVAMGSWIASVFAIASPVGSFASGPMNEYLGRKPTLMLSVVPLIIGWVIIAMAQSHLMILLGRIIGGIALGLVLAPSMILMTECVQPNLRGILVATQFAGYSIGILIVYSMGLFLHWRNVAWCSIIVPVIAFFGLAFIYETPVWLARKNKWDEAKKALTWLRGSEEYAKVEFDELKRRMHNERELIQLNKCKENENFFVLIRKRSIVKPMIIINGFNLLQTISGSRIFILYAVDIIKEFGADLDPRQTAIITALDRLLFIVVFCYLLYKMSRRTTVIMSGVIGGLSSLALSVYLIIRKDEPKSALDLYITTAFIAIYISANTGFMVLFGVVTELLPANVRGQFGGYVFAVANLLLFVFAKIFPHIQPDIGSVGTFMVFGLGSCGAALLMYLMLPETQNMTLHEIEDYFEGDNWLWAKREKTSHS